MRLGVPFDVRPDVRTGRDDPEAAPPGVVEREPGQLAGESAAHITTGVLRNVRTFAGGAPQSDDVAILTLKVNGGAA